MRNAKKYVLKESVNPVLSQPSNPYIHNVNIEKKNAKIAIS